MKLHANAKLSVKGRELLIDRVEHAGWSLIAAAEAAGISDRTARKWLARYRGDGAEGLLDRSSAPVVVANRTDDHRIEVIAVLRRLRMTGAEIAEMPRDGALDRVGDPDPARAWGSSSGAASSPRTGISASWPGRADPHRRQETRDGLGSQGAGHRSDRQTEAPGERSSRRRLGVRARLRRRRHPPGLCRGPHRRESARRPSGSSAARSRSTPLAASPCNE